MSAARLWAAVCAVVVSTLSPFPAAASAAAQPAAAADGGGATVATPPRRVLDTRDGTGRGGTRAPVGPGQSVEVQIAGVAPVPVGATAVVFNLTAAEPSAATFVTAWPAGEPRPVASNLNTTPGRTVPNLVTVGLGAGGRISLYNSAGSTHLIGDVQGYVVPRASTSGGLFVDLTPARLLDTRATGKVGAGQSTAVAVAGVGGVPATGVSAVVLNLTATEPTADTYVTAHPAGGAPPNASTLNLAPGDTVANRVVVPVGAGGAVALYNARGAVHLVVDVGGYFTTGAVADAGSGLVRLSPTRILDTRTTTAVAGGTSRRVQVAGVAGIPGPAAEVPPTAVVLNLTAANPTAITYVAAWPAGLPRPGASDLNVRAGETRANLAVVKLGPTGAVDLFNAVGSVDLVVDVFAYYSGAVVLDPALAVLDAPPVTGISPTAITFAGNVNDLRVRTGGLIASAPTANAPDGFLRRVTALSEAAGVVTATAEPVPLDQAVRRGAYAGAIPLVPLPGKGSPGAFTLAVEGVDTDAGDGVVAAASLTGSVTLGADLLLRVKLGPAGLEVDFDALLDSRVTAELAVSGAYRLLARQYPLAEQDYAPAVLYIGPVPVVVRPRFDLVAGVEGAVDGPVGARVARSETTATGFELRGGAISPFAFSSGPPTFFTVTGPAAAAEFDVELRAALRSVFYGGHALGAGVAPRLTAAVDRACRFELVFGADALSEFETGMFGADRGSQSRAPLFARQRLATAQLPSCSEPGWVVDPAASATSLAAALAGPGITVESAARSGQVGRFSAPFGSIGLDGGAVLSTGVVQGAAGPNSSGTFGSDLGGPGDLQLGAGTSDAAALDITFVPATSAVELAFVVGSDEHPGGGADVFGAFVNGRDCAAVEHGFAQAPLTTSAVGRARESLRYRDNGAGSIDVQANGLTTVLRCVAPVSPNVPNRLHLAIADVGGGTLDSWAFVQRAGLRAI